MQPSFEQLGLANQAVLNKVLMLIGYHDIVMPIQSNLNVIFAGVLDISWMKFAKYYLIRLILF